MLLETEFETRANQQQLATWNEVDFGYQAPSAAPVPRRRAPAGRARQAARARRARADPRRPQRRRGSRRQFPEMVSPLTGKPVAAESAAKR